MCLFENSKILETGIKMMQPDMIRTIHGYKAYYAIDDMISQIYTFEVKKEKMILDTTVPDASVDLLFFEKTSGEFGARIIGPTKCRLSSYVVFEENTSYIGIRFKPCYPIMISGIPVKESYNHIIPITISDNIYKRMKWYLKMSTETDEILLQIKSALNLMFQGEPFREEEYCQAIEAVQLAIERYDPSIIGYVWDETKPRIQLEPRGERGYIELKAIQSK